MKKYQYTQQEHDVISAARKAKDTKELAKIVNKIRKTCIAEGRFTEVEDNRSEKKAKPAKKAKAQPAAEDESEESVEVHGAEETSVIIK